jgi:hypothetical protein
MAEHEQQGEPDEVLRDEAFASVNDRSDQGREGTQRHGCDEQSSLDRQRAHATPVPFKERSAGLRAEGEIGISSALFCAGFFYHLQKPVVVWRNCSTAVVIFFMVSAQPLGFMSRAPLVARAESAPLRDYMLQIETSVD